MSGLPGCQHAPCGRLRAHMPEADGQFWSNAAQSAVAGVVAALVATSLLECARTCRRWIARRRDVKYLRDLLIEGRQRVLEATNFHHQDANAKCPADVLRAAQYNNMIKKLDTGLEKWTANFVPYSKEGRSRRAGLVSHELFESREAQRRVHVCRSARWKVARNYDAAQGGRGAIWQSPRNSLVEATACRR